MTDEMDSLRDANAKKYALRFTINLPASMIEEEQNTLIVESISEHFADGWNACSAEMESEIYRLKEQIRNMKVSLIVSTAGEAIKQADKELARSND